MFGIIVLGYALFLWYKWYARLAAVFAPSIRPQSRISPGVLPASCLVIFLAGFCRYAESAVTGDVHHFCLYTAFLLLTLRMALRGLDVGGIQFLTESLERANPAVLPAVGGALLGVTAFNLGSNIGTGDEDYTTWLPLAAAIVLWLSYGVLLLSLTTIVEAVTIHRRRAAGIRLGMSLLAAGLILAKAAAGDWISFSATAMDFANAVFWLAALFTVAAVLEPGRPSSAARERTLVVTVLYIVLVSADMVLTGSIY